MSPAFLSRDGNDTTPVRDQQDLLPPPPPAPSDLGGGTMGTIFGMLRLTSDQSLLHVVRYYTIVRIVYYSVIRHGPGHPWGINEC